MISNLRKSNAHTPCLLLTRLLATNRPTPPHPFQIQTDLRTDASVIYPRDDRTSNNNTATFPTPTPVLKLFPKIITKSTGAHLVRKLTRRRNDIDRRRRRRCERRRKNQCERGTAQHSNRGRNQNDGSSRGASLGRRRRHGAARAGSSGQGDDRSGPTRARAILARATYKPKPIWNIFGTFFATFATFGGLSFPFG